jgi:uncharacterized protein (DUF983 family)
MNNDMPIWKAGLSEKCPHCGEGRLFYGFLTLRKQCEDGELD